MKTKQKNGGSAFPISYEMHDFTPGNNGKLRMVKDEGMYLLDWFAGQVLCGYASRPGSLSSYSPEYSAEYLYKIANAMINERKKWIK